MSTATAMRPSTSTCSQRRATANRENARRSTGPRTPIGKARAALNALKSGAYARTPILPGEEETELESFVADIIEDLAPATAMERELAERVAGLSWRRRRLHRAELELIAAEFGDAEDRPKVFAGKEDRKLAEFEARLDGQMFLAGQFEGRGPGPLVRLVDHDRRISGMVDAALRMLLRLQDRRAKREREGDQGVDEASDLLTEEMSPPLLAPARRAEFSSESPAAPNEPTDVPPIPLSTPHPKGEPSPESPTAPNEPTSDPVPSIAPRHAPAPNEANATRAAQVIGVDSRILTHGTIDRCSSALPEGATRDEDSGAAPSLPRRERAMSGNGHHPATS
jgi:hypothetical protein